MTPPKAPKAAKRPLVLALSAKDERLLTAFREYRLLTALDCSHLGLYSPKSLTHVRERLARLCGNKDVTDKYLPDGYPLVRWGFPSVQGNRERIFALSSTGRQIVESLGLPVSWHCKVAKLRTFSHSHLLHALTLNRSVIAFHAMARSMPNITVQSHLSYELSKNPPVVSIPEQGKMVKVAVICDGLLLVENVRSSQRLAVIFEADHNTESLPRLRTHIAARLAYVQSPQFTKTYGTIPYRIAYATYGQTQSASQARLKSMLACTMDVLTALKREKDARYFRFTTINFPTLYEDAKALWEQPVWYRPDEPTTPVPLLTA
jgi:hypothetical protein